MNYVELKSSYRKNLKTGLGVSLILHLFLLLFFILIKGDDIQEKSMEYGARLTYIDLSPETSNVPPSIVPQKSGGGGTRSVSGTPVPVKNIKDEKVFSNESSLGDSTKNGDGGSGSGLGTGGNYINVFKKTDYMIAVEMQPEPIGGMAAINRKVIYPESARKNSIQGKVFLQIYVNENGEVVFAEVLKGLGFGCDEAAIRAVKLVRFKAGKNKGRYVKVQMSLPVNFII